MDPGLPNAHAGTSTLVLLFLCLASGLAAAPSGGQAVKKLRNFSPSTTTAPAPAIAEPAPSGPSGGAGEIADARPVETPAGAPFVQLSVADEMELSEAESAPAGAGPVSLADAPLETTPVDVSTLPPAEIVSLPSIEVSAAGIASEPSASPAEAASKAPASGAYLPSGGSLPLRFAEARGWPAPLPADAIRRIGEASVASSTDGSKAGAPGADPAEAGDGGETRPDSVAGGPSAIREGARYPESGDGQPLRLTADLVLGYMNDVSGDRGLQRDSFLPAMVVPAGRSPLTATSLP